MARLFVAVWPAPVALAALSDLPRPPVDGLRWTRPEQWHVTLRFLGGVDDVNAARIAFAAIDSSVTTATMGPVTDAFGDRVLHVPVHGLDRLAAATVAATAGIGDPPDSRPFAGHVTLARASHRRFRPDLAPLTGVDCSACWPVTDVTLVASRGGLYEVLERLPLRP